MSRFLQLRDSSQASSGCCHKALKGNICSSSVIGLSFFFPKNHHSLSSFSSDSSDDLGQFSDGETTEADGDGEEEEEEVRSPSLEALENEETLLLTPPPPPPPEEEEEADNTGLKGGVFTEDDEMKEEEESGFIVKKEEGDYGGEEAPLMEANEELANAQEMSRRIEEFIRKMKEEIRIEVQQPLIAF